MIHFLCIVNRQGKVRLAKWYQPMPTKEKNKILNDLSRQVVRRSTRFCSMIEYQGRKYVSRRYASLFIIACVDEEDNELELLEIIHNFVVTLDKYFENVCELDLIFNFHRAFFILDEVILAGEIQEAHVKDSIGMVRLLESAAEKSEENFQGDTVAHQLVAALKNL